MPCIEVVDYGHIRPGEVSGFGATPCSTPVGISVLQYANVTKLLDRKEHYRDPKAREAIRLEGESLVDKGTWLLQTVIEKKDLIAKSKGVGPKDPHG